MKTNIKNIFLLLSIVVPVDFLWAAPSLNEMQKCQALLDFLDKKMDGMSKYYLPEDLKKIKYGLHVYNVYIQNNVISPGLLTFVAGDAARAKNMQAVYKLTLVKGLNRRYPQSKLRTDYAVAVNNCSKKLVPAGKNL